jgi:hypothetical protein
MGTADGVDFSASLSEELPALDDGVGSEKSRGWTPLLVVAEVGNGGISRNFSTSWCHNGRPSWLGVPAAAS